jgi:hypothetical protein
MKHHVTSNDLIFLVQEPHEPGRGTRPGVHQVYTAFRLEYTMICLQCPVIAARV